MPTDVVMVVYTEHGDCGGFRTAHRYALASSITPEIQTKVFDVLENTNLWGTDPSGTAAPAINFVRLGLYPDLDKRIENSNRYREQYGDIPALSNEFRDIISAGFWHTTRKNDPTVTVNQPWKDANVFVIPEDWVITRVIIVNTFG